MASEKPLSSQEVTDLIHKLGAESANVFAQLVFRQGITVSLVGRLEVSNDGGLIMLRGKGSDSIVESPVLLTSLSALLKADCAFADPRVFKGGHFADFFEHYVRFTFGLLFLFADKSTLCVLEVSK